MLFFLPRPAVSLLNLAAYGLLIGVGQFGLLDGTSVAHTFWMGSDNFGRDIYSRVIYGTRVSLSIGFAAAAFSVLIGIPLGAFAGYFGGRTDWVIMRIIELFSVVPSLLAAIGEVLDFGRPAKIELAVIVDRCS